MSDCVFCKISAGEIPARLVSENEHALAFWDISPRQPIHILVIPRDHHTNVGELVANDELLALEVLKLGTAVAREFTDGSYRFSFNTGESAGQTVFHAHGHITALSSRN